MVDMPRFLLLAALAACTASEAAPPATRVELAAVTLGEDCAPPPSTPATPARPAPGAFAPSSRTCEQTSIQLSIASPAGAAATALRVTRVELLDAKGARLQMLTVRTPQRFLDGEYQAWDGKLAAGETVSAMYALSAPNWSKLTGGRWNAHDKVFQVRVTYALGGRSRTVVKQAVSAARIDPAVPT